MRSTLIFLFAAMLLCLCGPQALAQSSDPASNTNEVRTQLRNLVFKVKTKVKEGKKTEADLAPELKEFDQILAQHKGEKTDEVGQVALMKAMLYVQVFDDPKKATVLMTQVKQDYPGTRAEQYANRILETLKGQDEATRIQRALVDGAKFPNFAVTDINGKPLSITNYQGKVVLVDFWATWCSPCVQELPNVIKAYKQYHSQGFEIIGVSLDSEKSKLTSFLKEKDVTWPQYFDGKQWQNELAVKYGVRAIPATYLLDGKGDIIGKNLRGEALSAAVAKALAQK